MLWAASYGSMAATGYQSQPWGLGSAGEGMLQYSSNGWLNGHGPLDLDIFLGDRTAWYKIAMGERGGAVAPAPATNPSSSSKPKTTTKTSRTYYTVRAGDTLSGIGSRTGVAWRTIASINGIHSPWIIYPGQRLVVKSTTSESASASTGTRYTVRRGDTLSGIGSRTGVAWRTISSINGIHSPWIIYPGQVLRLR